MVKRPHEGKKLFSLLKINRKPAEVVRMGCNASRDKKDITESIKAFFESNLNKPGSNSLSSFFLVNTRAPSF